MGSSNQAGTLKTLCSCLCGSGKRYAMVGGLSGSILGKRMMQGEATIESFPHYPRKGQSTTSSSHSCSEPIGCKRLVYQRSDWLGRMLGEEEAHGSRRVVGSEREKKRSY